jgi:hypothetical protein
MVKFLLLLLVWEILNEGAKYFSLSLSPDFLSFLREKFLFSPPPCAIAKI